VGGGVRVIFRLAITYLLALKFVFKVNTQLFQESKKANGCFVAPGGGGGKKKKAKNKKGKKKGIFLKKPFVG